MTLVSDEAADRAAALLWDHVAGTQGWGLDWPTAKVEEPEMAAACVVDARRYVEAAAPVIASDAIEAVAADIYNADPDPNFVKRQTFYNEGVNPWLMEKARIIRAGGKA